MLHSCVRELKSYRERSAPEVGPSVGPRLKRRRPPIFRVSLLLNEGVDEVGRGSRPVAVGLGRDNVVVRGSVVGELTGLGGSSTGEAVLVEASELLAGDVEIKVAAIEDPDLELTVRVGADGPVDDSVDVGGDGVAAEDGLLLELESDLALPAAGAVDGGVVVGGEGRAEGGVEGGPGGARGGVGAQVASTVDATAAAGRVGGGVEATISGVSAPQAS